MNRGCTCGTLEGLVVACPSQWTSICGYVKGLPLHYLSQIPRIHGDNHYYHNSYLSLRAGADCEVEEHVVERRLGI